MRFPEEIFISKSAYYPRVGVNAGSEWSGPPKNPTRKYRNNKKKYITSEGAVKK
jgi:hypothetical protein